MIENAVIKERKNSKENIANRNNDPLEYKQSLTRKKNIWSLVIVISSFIVLLSYTILSYLLIDIEDPFFENVLNKLNITIIKDNSTKS